MNWSTELTAERLTFIGPDAAGAPWIAGHQLWERRGALWATVAVAEAEWNSVRPGPGDQLWAASLSGPVAFRNTSGWHASEPTGGQKGVDVAPFADETWVTDTHNRIHRWRAETGWELWTPDALANHHTGVLWGSAADDVWVHVQPQATGRAPEFGHWNGSRWRIESLQTKGYIAGMHGRSSTDVWAAGWSTRWIGKGPLAAHWDGAQWTEVPLPTRHRLTSVHVQSDGTVWLAGFGGTLLRGNAAGFTALEAPEANLNGVYSDGTRVWVLGEATRVHVAEVPED